MKNITFKFFSCDFETTVYKAQVNTEVWASACVELFTEDVVIFHSIEDTFNYFKDLNCNICAYYHNLKFDGNFWLSFLLKDLHLKQAVKYLNDEKTSMVFDDIKDMKNNTFKYVISDMGQWYSITIKVNDHIIEIRDSLKLLPFSVKEIGKSFGTKHKKLDMEYKGYRYAGCEITNKEKEYLKNDVLVVKEALEIMFEEGHNKLTIGSCCLAEFKKTIEKEDYNNFFPNLYEIPYEDKSVGDYIRRSYRGGWCYLLKGKENKIYNDGCTLDVNSLYPSMMHSMSGNRYPVGKPHFWKGYIPEEAIAWNRYYFVRIKTRFYLKKDKLPFVKIKHSLLYKGTEMLESSDVINPETGEHSPYYTRGGEVKDTRVEMVLTMTDYELLKEHYELVDFEVIDGCWFFSEIGLFDPYIDKYAAIKMTSKGAKRESAKLFLNNLYGKLASSTDSSFKVAYVKEDGSLGFYTVSEHDKSPGYIPCGSAITSYARNFTIRAAQANYDHFIYSDTDSIHCNMNPLDVKGVKLDSSKFCCWKPESQWDEAMFIRQKTYVEHITHENLKPVETPYYDIKCAGMPQKCKNLFEWSMSDELPEGLKLSEEEEEFVKCRRELKDFTIGLEVPGKLRPKRMKGGVLLVNTTYKMK